MGCNQPANVVALGALESLRPSSTSMTTPTTKRNAYHRSILYGVGSTDHRQVLSRNSDSTSTSPRRARESTTPIWTGYIQDAKVPLATREASFLRYPPYVAEDLSGDFTDASAATHRRSPVHHLSHAVETSSHRTPFLIPEYTHHRQRRHRRIRCHSQINPYTLQTQKFRHPAARAAPQGRFIWPTNPKLSGLMPPGTR